MAPNPFTADNRHGALQDVSGNQSVGFEDTFLGDLLGFDGQVGAQGAGLVGSLQGDRRMMAVQKLRAQGAPVTEDNVRRVLETVTNSTMPQPAAQPAPDGTPATPPPPAADRSASPPPTRPGETPDAQPAATPSENGQAGNPNNVPSSGPNPHFAPPPQTGEGGIPLPNPADHLGGETIAERFTRWLAGRDGSSAAGGPNGDPAAAPAAQSTGPSASPTQPAQPAVPSSPGVFGSTADDMPIDMDIGGSGIATPPGAPDAVPQADRNSIPGNWTGGNLVLLPGHENLQTGDKIGIRDNKPVIMYANGTEQQITPEDYQAITGQHVTQAFALAQQVMAGQQGGI